VPVVLVDGVPFVVTRGYALGGEPEQSDWCVRYCLASCDRNPVRFAEKSQAEKEAALGKLLASPKWNTSLDAYDQEFFSDQIQ
jgi:hypothetical protein